jgi:hypothetical protein
MQQIILGLEGNGYFNYREIEGRGVCAMAYFFFTVAILYGLTDEWIEGRYCFETEAEAQKSFDEWDGVGDPTGNWIKHKGVREYSNPNYIKTEP